MPMQWLLARDGAVYIVSAHALESAPYVRVLAYRVDADPDDADGRAVHTEWAYSGPRRATYRSTTHLPRAVVYDPSKTADLVLDYALPVPKCRKLVHYVSGRFFGNYANGMRPLMDYTCSDVGLPLARFVASVFPSKASETLPPETEQRAWTWP